MLGFWLPGCLVCLLRDFVVFSLRVGLPGFLMSVVPPRLAWFPLSRFFWLSGFWFPGFLDFVYWCSGPGFWFLVSWLPVFLVSGVVCRFPGCWVSWLLGYWFSDLLVSWGPGFVVFPFARSKEAWARGPRGPGNLGLLGL